MKLVVGLGNPGIEYENTRHNIGFMVLNRLSDNYNFIFNKNKFSGVYSEIIINNEKVILLKPQKYMNLSGEVVRDYVNFFKIPIENILVYADDLDLPCGTVRIRKKGSSGGHNGLKDIEKNLSTQNYNRVKVGISNDKSIDTRDYVLGKFNKEEIEIINNSIEECCDIFTVFVNNNDIENLMAKYNARR